MMLKILQSCLLAVLVLTSGAWAQAARKPNVIVIMADDMGYADYSAYPQSLPDIKTPNIDRLAATGIRCTQGYVTSPICSASRLGMLTGRYQQRWGVHFYGGATLPKDKVTLAELLKKEGYATGMVGKNHMDTRRAGRAHPMDFGFDSFYGFNHGTAHFFTHTKAGEKLFAGGNLTAGPLWVNRDLKDQEGYMTELIEREALSFIDQHHEEPFFLYVPFSAVHLFIQVPEKDLKAEGLKPFDMWDPVKEPGRAGYLKWYYRTLKRFGDDAEPHDPDGRARYRICLRYMDKAIGSLLDRVEQYGLSDDTLIIFLSDNGGSPRNYSNNGPLRGYKYNLYEGGVRVPMLMSWPGKLAGNSSFDGVISSLDILPTVMSAAAAALPANLDLDGINMLPALRRKQPAQERSLYWKKGKETSWSVRSGDWKLIKVKAGFELYNLAKDLGEKSNLAKTMPEKVQTLKARFEAWEKLVKPVNKKDRNPF